MPSASHDLSHLSGLIEAAKAEAERLGPTLSRTAALLDQSLGDVRGLAARDGHPDEGTPLQELTTENDR